MKFFIPTRLIFVLGFITGILLSFLLKIGTINIWSTSENLVKYSNYEECFIKGKCSRKVVPYDTLRYEGNKYILESELLFKTLLVYCLILVTKENNLEAIKDTWGKGCNTIHKLNVHKKAKIFPLKHSVNDNVWIQFCETLKNTSEVYEWILVANDDTFVIMENLRYFLAYRNSSQETYLGYPVKFWNTPYNLGKAGFVLSKGTINAMRKSNCGSGISFRNKEDFILGSHLAALNISTMDTKDERGLSLFHPFNLNRLLFPEDSHDKFNSIYQTRCCSRHTITFNAIEADKMYTYYYMLYTLQLFHSGYLGNRKPKKPPDEEIWKNFLKQQNLPLNITSDKYYDAWENFIDSPDSFGRDMRREEYPDESQ